MVVGGGKGEDVEDVGGDYPSASLRTGSSGEEVDLVGGVGDAVVVEVALVGVFLAFIEGAFDPFVAVAPQGRLWTRRKRPWWSLRSLFALSGQALRWLFGRSGQATRKS